MVTYDRGSAKFIAVSRKNGARIRKTINDDPERIYRLANKAYAEEAAKRLRFNKDKLDAFLSELKPLDYNSILQDLPKNYDLLDPARVMAPKRF